MHALILRFDLFLHDKVGQYDKYTLRGKMYAGLHSHLHDLG